MRNLAVILILVLGLAAIGIIRWLAVGDHDDPALVPPEVPDERAAGVVEAPIPGADPQEPAVETSAREELPTSPPDEPAAQVADEEERLAEVRGRFLLPGGAPAAGAAVGIHGWRANSDRVRKFGRPTDYEDPSTMTDHEGRFSIRFDPPQAYQFTLDAKVGGCSEESWRWSRIETGAVVDVGTVTFKSAGTIVGSIVDSSGNPVAGRWRVYADAVQQSGMEGKDQTRVAAPYDPTTGRFRLDGLPAGPTRLKAYLRIANWIDGPVVQVVDGQEVEATIVYDGPDNSRRIVVVTFTRPFFTLDVEGPSIHLSAPGVGIRDAIHIQGSSQSYAFDEMSPGSYTIEIDDPRFQPWSRSGVKPGVSVDAMLKGNAGVQLEVVDGRSGEPIEEYVLDVRLDDSNSRPNVFRIREAGKEAPAAGLYDGLVPVPQTLLIEAEGFAAAERPVPELQPFETRALRIELFPGVRLGGVVYEADRRTPVPGARVWLVPPGGEPRTGSFGESETFQRETRTDDTGRFELAEVPAGTYSLLADANAWLVGRIEELEVVTAEDRSDLVVVLPPSASLRGRLIAPAGESFQDLRLTASPSAEPAFDDFSVLYRRGFSLALDGAGQFTTGPLPPGELVLSLRGPEVRLPSGFSSGFGTSGPTVEIARLELRAGEILQREFDLRDRWPGAIRFDVRRNGQPAPGVVVEVAESDPERQGRSGATTEPDGTATVRFLFPGDYSVSARSVEGTWAQQVPGVVHVWPSETATCSIEIVLVRGTVHVVEEHTGAPMANQELLIELEGAGRAHRATTDAEGRLELELPPGSYTIARSMEFGFPGRAKVPLEWTVAGPESGEIRLPFE